MKSIIKRLIINTVGVLAMLGIMASCSDEVDYDKASELSKNVLLRSVKMQSGEEWVELDETNVLRVGTVVRLEGDNLNQVDKVYFNGYEVQEEFLDIAKTFLITKIPDETPVGNEVENEQMRDTIYVVSNNYGQGGLRLRILSKNFSVSSIYDSNDKLISTAEIGQTIYLNGTDLNHIVKIYLNGSEISTENYTIDSENLVTITIPEDILVLNLPESNVAIRVVNEFGEEYSYDAFKITGRIPRIDRVTNGSEDNITEVKVNDVVSVYGSEFGNSPTVTLNGVEMESELSGDGDCISFTVTEDVIDGDNSGKLIITTEHGSIAYDLKVVFETPVVDRVSHTLPRAGERIVIYGVNLGNVNKVVFPGEQEVSIDNTAINTDGTQIEVVVPEGGDVTAGALKVVTSSGAVAYSYSYMNCKAGLFIENFSSGSEAYLTGGKDMSNSNEFTINNIEGEWPKSPDTYRSLKKNNSGTINVGPSYYSGSTLFELVIRFSVPKAFEMAKNGYGLSGTELCEDYAIQFDCYMTSDNSDSWVTTVLDLCLDGTSKAYIMAPWHKDYLKADSYIDADFSKGWKTLIVPMSELQDMNGKTFDEMNSFTTASGKTSYFRLIGAKYGSSSGSDMQNFAFHFGNFRIVPYTKPSVEE